MIKERHAKYINLGVIDYKEAWDYQSELAQIVIKNKREDYKNKKVPHHYIVFCQHNNVFTLGKSGTKDNLLLSDSELKDKDIDYYPINRGGDITYHGPGQLVVYPIFDLDLLDRDVHVYVRNLEQVIINVLNEYNLKAVRIKDYTGVWFDDKSKRKICAIGVHMSRWVSMHGLAFNVSPDLSFFNKIIPCGIQENDKSVTSLEKELGTKIDLEEIENKVKSSFEKVFNIKIN